MRVNKYIAQCGAASRRKADELIAAGQVKLNGELLKAPGYDVQPGDKISVCGKLLEAQEELVYYLLNKPRGYLTTTSDDKGRATVMELMSDVSVRLFPVGRLDFDSAGALIMTNDGELSQHIAHPKNKVWKSYELEVSGQLNLAKMAVFRRGIIIDGRMTAPAEGRIVKQKGDMSLVEVSISEGRNRQLRKMFEALGCKVSYLRRTAIGEVKLGRLHEGDYRRLSASEIEYLKHC